MKIAVLIYSFSMIMCTRLAVCDDMTGNNNDCYRSQQNCSLEVRIGPNEEKVVVRPITVDGSVKFQLFRPNTTRPFQVINTESESDHAKPEFDDMNFDGFLDVGTTMDVGASGNTSMSWWLYNPKLHIFEPHTQLSYSNLGADKINKVLKGSWKYGVESYSSETYKWFGNSLKKVERSSTAPLESLCAETSCCVVHKKFKIKNEREVVQSVECSLTREPELVKCPCPPKANDTIEPTRKHGVH